MGCSTSQHDDGGNTHPSNVEQGNDSEAIKRQRRKLSVAPQHVGEGQGKSLLAESNGSGSSEALNELEIKSKGSMKHSYSSKKGMVPYNKNKVNQDRYVFKYAVADDPSVCMWGVMDGHGEFGHYVAQFVQEHLPQYLAKEKNIKQQPEQCITQAVKNLCDQLAATDINASFSGSTCVFGVRIDNMLYVANIGDSRCVLARQGPDGKPVAIGLSIDQKPERPSEKARIESCGGRVEPLPGPPGECGPARVWLAEADVPGLAMSRSIGDVVSQTVGVISTPEIVAHQIEGNDIFAVWASDGVWEFLSSEQSINILWDHRDNLQKACDRLVDEASKQWREQEEVIDDITAIVVQFNPSK